MRKHFAYTYLLFNILFPCQGQALPLSFEIGSVLTTRYAKSFVPRGVSLTTTDTLFRSFSSSSKKEQSEADRNDGIVTLLKRVLTKGAESCRQLTPSKDDANQFHIPYQARAFLHQNRINRWLTTHPEADSFSASPVGNINAQFHEELFRRINCALEYDPGRASKNLVVPKYLRSHPLDPKDIGKKEEYNFVPGHMIYYKGRTTQPKVFVSLYAHNEIDESKQKFINWVTPIEQALFCRTLKQYRNYMALNKIWGAYSNFAVVLIPAGIEIEYYMGLVGPQSLPSFVRDNPKSFFKPEENTALEKLKLFKTTFNPKDFDEESFFEYLEGGATQYRLIAVENPLIIETKDSILKGNSPLPKYSIKNVRHGWDSDDRSNIPQNNWHPLTDNSYDSANINILASLKELGAITQKECEEMQYVLQNFTLQ